VSLQTNDNSVKAVYFTGTSSVEDKLDADARSVWVGNVSYCSASAVLYSICGTYFIICCYSCAEDCCNF